MKNDQLGPLIKAVNTLFERELDNQLSAANDVPYLTRTQARLLGYLLTHEDTVVYQRDLENIFYLSRPTINGLVKRLRENHFITVLPSPEDKRFKQVQLTQKTREQMQAHQKDFETLFAQIEERMTQGMSQSDVQKFRELLEMSVRNLQK
ncbi:MarR family winged helix-turn-helix transcriptional regulator [Lentilactobacillus otakiensis]|uniref:MarR family winged helix-turn-helix transcriptional regulator n=1 Tax=Lentilactobacillus otakiensis TaxID=481720 RepID=UPI003D17C8AD